MRKALTIALSMYLGAGLFAGLMAQRAVPALNLVGVVFITMTWPNQIRCARVESKCDAIPSKLAPYIFSFKGENNE